MRVHMTPAVLLSLAALAACSPDAPRDPLAPSAPIRSVGGSAAPAPAVARGARLPFHGTLAAFETVEIQPATNTGLVHVEGTGTATHLGRFTFVNDFTLDFNVEALAGLEQMTLTAANGDVLTATAVGQGVPTGDGATLDTFESATITGGTGRFAGATGSFILRRVLVEATGISAGSFTGTISLRK